MASSEIAQTGRICFCKCPPPINYDDLVIKPVRTPLDKLGYPQKLCCCCKLGVAASFVCFLSLLWGVYELQTADKFIATIFPKRDEVFFYCKMVYLLIVMFFVLACGGLFFGLIVKRYEPINVYLWYAFLFNFLMIVCTIGGSVFTILTTGYTNNKQTCKTVLGLIWCCLFFYMLMVVNSYKLLLW